MHKYVHIITTYWPVPVLATILKSYSHKLPSSTNACSTLKQPALSLTLTSPPPLYINDYTPH